MDELISAVTLSHVLISLAAIGAGFVVVGSLLEGRSRPLPSRLFLGTTALTSLTGFLFPLNGFTPALGVGAVSLVVLAPTCFALMARGLAGCWRTIYVLGVVTLLYLNFFVLVVQLFLKVPAMQELAPTQREAPFLLVQLALLVAFVTLALRANAGFRQSSPADVRSP